MDDPFSPRASGRDPFPPFEAAMARPAAADGPDEAADAPDEAADEAAGPSALDWSIDTLAELLPVPMTPSSAQKRAARASPPPSAASASASVSASASAASSSPWFDDPARLASLRTPSPLATRPAELHARCRDAIALYQRRLRDRQRRIDSLQVRASGSSSSSPPPKRTRPNADKAVTPTISSVSGSNARRSPHWWASPAPAARASLSFASPSPGAPAPPAPPSFACELSPIPAAERSPDAAASRSEPKDKENQQQRRRPVGDGGPPPESPPASAAVARRQEAFAAAMEAEAAARTRARPPPGSLLALHAEAKALGLADARARWEFVRLLRPAHGRPKA